MPHDAPTPVLIRFADAPHSPTPPDEHAGALTRLLAHAGRGDREAYDRLFALVHDELRAIAGRQLRRARGSTLAPTELVSELYLKLGPECGADARDRAHFFGIAARAMRQLLVDHARRRRAVKRGGSAAPVTFDDALAGDGLAGDELLALDDALERLDARQRRIVELRFFAGLGEREIAELTGSSVRTVRREWVRARARLHLALYGPGASDARQHAVA